MVKGKNAGVLLRNEMSTSNLKIRTVKNICKLIFLIYLHDFILV